MQNIIFRILLYPRSLVTGLKINSNFAIFTSEALIRTWTFAILILCMIGGIKSAWANNIATFIFVSAASTIIIFVQKCQSKSNFDALKWNRLSILFLLLSVIVTLGWTIHFGSIQVSDFGVYFRCGIFQNISLLDAIDNCQSLYLEPNSTYWSRSFFYSFPLSVLFGENYNGFILGNAFLHIATIFIWYFGIRRSYDSRIALISSILLFIYPEYWFSSTLISSDNAALLCIALFLLILPTLDQSGKYASVLAIALGIVIFLAHKLRSIGPILLISVFVWSISRGPRISRQIYKNIFFVFIVFVTISKSFSFFFHTALPDLVNPLKLLSAIDFHSTQDFATNYLWSEHFWRSIPKDRVFDTAINKIASELSDFGYLPIYLYKKAEVVFSGGGYYGLSSFNFPPGNPDSSTNITRNAIPFIPELFPWFSALICLMAIASGKTVLRISNKEPAFTSLIFIGVFGFIVLALGESQSRYSILVAPAFALLASLSLFPQNSNGFGIKEYKNSNLLFQLALGSLFISTIYLIIVLNMWISSFKKSITESAKITYSTREKKFNCSNLGVRIDINDKKLKILFDQGSECAIINISVPANKKSLSFFVSGSKFPYRFENKYASPFTYQLVADDIVLLNASLDMDTVQWREVSIKNTTIQNIYIYVNRSNSDVIDQLNFSFFRAY